ncbi:MAG: carbamate kinase [Gemmatimonadota bacterium]|jgi:carbamate kinase
MIAQPEHRKSDARSIVVALGGNALLAPGERGDIHQQFAHTRESLAPIVELAREGWNIAIAHGNGPQVGDELLRQELGRTRVPPLPLGVLVAGTAGWIGYMIQQSLENALNRDGIDRRVATVITQVVVDREHPATHEPSKPIGRVMDEATARALQEEVGWHVGPVNDGWRRLVPSPIPREIVEREQVRRLVQSGNIVIAVGGGGTPVYRHPTLGLEGIDAVVDKDRAAEVLARDIGADVLLILTNVDGVYRDYGTDTQELVRELSVDEAEAMLAEGQFGRGSMAPKVEAAVSFVRSGGRAAYIARLNEGLAAVDGRAGTAIRAATTHDNDHER